MPRVSGGECRTSGERDPGYLGIPHVDRSAGSLPLRCQSSGCIGRGSIDIENPIFEIFFEQPSECRYKGCSTLPVRKNGESETRLEQRYARNPDRLHRLPIQPLDHCGFWRFLHQRRKHVRVQDNHFPNSAGFER